MKTIKITIEIDGEENKTHFNSVEKELCFNGGLSFADVENVLDQALTEFVEKNKPGTSRDNPIIVKSWMDVKVPGYYAHENKPEFWVQFERNTEYDEPFYMLVCASDSIVGFFIPMQSENKIKTWKTIAGAAQYVEKQLENYWK